MTPKNKKPPGTPEAVDLSSLLARVDELLRDVKRLRFEVWSAHWAGGKHREAPPCPVTLTGS